MPSSLPGTGPGAPDSTRPPGERVTPRVAIIGGTGLGAIDGLAVARREPGRTRWGATSAPLVHGRLDGHDVVFLARHAPPPALANYVFNGFAWDGTEQHGPEPAAMLPSIADESAVHVPVILDLIEDIRKDASKTVLLVEHKMDVVRALADRIVVLHNGELVADGVPDEVIALPIVREIYLGIPAGEEAA